MLHSKRSKKKKQATYTELKHSRIQAQHQELEVGVVILGKNRPDIHYFWAPDCPPYLEF